jgi:peroxiredoxin
MNMTMNPRAKYLVFLLLAFLSLASFALPGGYSIHFRVRGLRDTTCLIANYYGNGTYVYDTLKVDETGKFVLSAPDTLPKGIYIVVLTEKSYFEFIINNDREFSIETEKGDLLGKMKITGSPENTLFYKYLDYNRQKYTEVQDLQNLLKKVAGKKDSVALVNDKITSISNEMNRYRLELVDKNPGSFVAFFINVMKEPEVPEAPLLPNGRKDSTFYYRYYRSHFWDGTDFTDERLLRTPVFHNKLVKYFDKVVIQNPDSIIRESDILVDKSRPDPEMFKYLVWFCTNHYENATIMGFDRIFVHVVDRYYITNEAKWVNKTSLENLIKKANRLRPLLLGAVAPDMIMTDTSNRLVSMYSIRARFLILFFWDPDCGHCELEIPKLREFVDQNREKYGLEVFSVCSDTSLVKWKNTILKKGMNWINVDGPRALTGDYHEQYDVSTTPVIYILNERKEILAKNIRTEQVTEFIRNYTGK